MNTNITGPFWSKWLAPELFKHQHLELHRKCGPHEKGRRKTWGKETCFFRGVVWWMDFLVILVIRSNFSANCFMRHRNDSCFGNAIPRSSRSVRDMVHAEQICMAALDLVRSGTSITSNEYFPPEQKTMHWLAQIEISFCLLYKLNSYHACLYCERLYWRKLIRIIM